MPTVVVSRQVKWHVVEARRLRRNADGVLKHLLSAFGRVGVQTHAWTPILNLDTEESIGSASLALSAALQESATLFAAGATLANRAEANRRATHLSDAVSRLQTAHQNGMGTYCQRITVTETTGLTLTFFFQLLAQESFDPSWPLVVNWVHLRVS